MSENTNPSLLISDPPLVTAVTMSCWRFFSVNNIPEHLSIWPSDCHLGKSLWLWLRHRIGICVEPRSEINNVNHHGCQTFTLYFLFYLRLPNPNGIWTQRRCTECMPDSSRRLALESVFGCNSCPTFACIRMTASQSIGNTYRKRCDSHCLRDWLNKNCTAVACCTWIAETIRNGHNCNGLKPDHTVWSHNSIFGVTNFT